MRNKLPGRGLRPEVGGYVTRKFPTERSFVFFAGDVTEISSKRVCCIDRKVCIIYIHVYIDNHRYILGVAPSQ